MESFVGQIKMPLLLSAIVLSGCGGPNHQTICEKSEDCIDGNDKDVAACVAQRDAEEEIAGDVGCGSEYDAYYECFQDAARCKNKNYGIEANDCETEKNAYQHCGGHVDVGGQ